MKIFFFNIFLFCSLSTFTWGQKINTNMSSEAMVESSDELLNIKLPPLDELFESARNNPAVEIFKIKQQQDASSLKSEKRKWLNYFRVTASYQYGSIGYNNYMSTPDISPVYTSSGYKQSWYNFGGSISIPLDDLFDRSNRVKRQRLLLKQSELEIEKWHDEQKLLIIDAYSDILENLAVLKIKAEAVDLTNAQYKIRENDFINGKISVSVLNEEKEAQVSTISEYEKTKAILNKSLLRLEILSKMKIINK